MTKDEAIKRAADALERAETLLLATARFITENRLDDFEVEYDEATCDGNCLGTDVVTEASECQHVTALLRAALAEPEWRPIGPDWDEEKKVLGWSAEYGQRETEWSAFDPVTIAYQRWKLGIGPRGRWLWSEPQSNWGSSWKPTHYRELPEPPEAV